MKRAVLSLFFTSLLIPATACNGGGSGGSGSPDIKPFRQSDWQVEAQVPFTHTMDDMSLISALQIGGRLTGGSNKNFANRGDVIVLFDGPENQITVEFRRFTAAANDAAADEDFKALSLWAFNANQSTPLPPDEMEAEALCNNDTGWLNNCAIRVYYDGLTQLARAGADIRVTLPPSYQRTVSVITEDNDDDAAYFNRGNVCVDGLRGTADVTLQSGQAFVKLAPDVKVAPLCSDDFIARCEAWPCDPGAGTCMVGDDLVDEGSQAWANECPCVAQVMEFGRVKVDTHDSAAADMTVDLPSTLWASITAKNEQIGQDSSDPDKHCEVTIDPSLPNFEIIDGPGNDFPWERRGQINYPGLPAVAGAGYSVQATSKNCEPVPSTEDPNDYVGAENGSDQESTERGNITICSGCLAASSCDQLLP